MILLSRKKAISNYRVSIFFIQIRTGLIGAKDAVICSFTNLDNKLQVWTHEPAMGTWNSSADPG